MSTDIAQTRAEEIIARIVELQPWLRTQQATAEQERRIPQETIERLDAAGVFSLTKPKRYGGADFNTREMLDIYRALGAGCARPAGLSGRPLAAICGATPSPKRSSRRYMSRLG
jgi:alkylation response protein AidB-like acyl-CoA dehydrogenase